MSEEVFGYWECRPGLTMEGVTYQERTQPDGETKYWRASSPIGSIFGMEVEGECEGFGSTKEKALERLHEAAKKLYEGLWV